MEVTVENLGRLKRKMSVEVPLDEVSGAYDAVYAQIRTNVRVDGFRPGKYPRHLAEKRFKEMMAQEATRSLLPKYYEQVLREKELNPATEPHFSDLDIDKARPFRFNVEFEIVPEFEMPPVGEFSIDERDVKLEPGAVDEKIESYRAARATTEDKGQEPAAEGDVVTFDFEGTRDGEPFAGGSGKDQTAELGSARYLEKFEEELVGTKAGEEKEFDLTFPDDYGEPSMAGQTARFRVTVKSVQKKVPAEMNEAFFSQFGEEIKTEEAFREFVEKQIMEDMKREVDQEYMKQTAEQIKSKVDFDVPEELVERAMTEFEHKLTHEEPAPEGEKLAQRKEEETRRLLGGMRLSYVLEHFASEHQIKPDKDALRNRFFMQAYMMQQSPEELINSDYGAAMFRRIEEEMLHQAALKRLVDLILGRAPEEPEKSELPAGGGTATAAGAAGLQDSATGAEAQDGPDEDASTPAGQEAAGQEAETQEAAAEE